jgi:hypothetical protein
MSQRIVKRGRAQADRLCGEVWVGGLGYAAYAGGLAFETALVGCGSRLKDMPG